MALKDFFTPFFRFLLQSIIIDWLLSDIFGFWFYFFRRRLLCVNSSVIQGCHKNLISFQFFKYGFHGNYRHRNMITFTYLITLLLMLAFLLKTLKSCICYIWFLMRPSFKCPVWLSSFHVQTETEGVYLP